MKEYHKQLDIRPAILLSDAKSAFDYFEIFSKNVALYLCQRTNDRATKNIEDITYKATKLYGPKWRPD